VSPTLRVAGAALLVAVLALALLRGDRGDGEGGGAERSGGVVMRPGGELQARLERVVDGDTIEVRIGGAVEDVRLIGIDTPETVKPGSPVECFGPEAAAATKSLFDRPEVRLRFDRELRDHYGRLLAYAFSGGRFVNEELVAGGFARTLEIEPNTSEAGRLSRSERAASRAGRGLWGAC
jgi:micrococcal nuclease